MLYSLCISTSSHAFTAHSIISPAGVREAAKKAYSAAWFAQDKLQFQAKQWRDKGRADKADAMEPKIAEAVATLKRMKVRTLG